MINIKINSPLDQFNEVKILEINGFWIQKSSLILIISLILLVLINLSSNKNINLKLNIQNITIISVYDSMMLTIKNQIMTVKYIIILISITLYVLIINLIGNLPYGYANTSSIIICLGLSVALWLSSFLLIISRYKFKVFSFFVPNGTPLILVPLLVLIEVVSYLSRSLSLGIRLFSNIVAGHTLIHLISSFIYNIMIKSVLIFVLIVLPFVVFLSLVGLELAVSFIQSYVFLLLISSYIRDSIYLH